VRYHRARNEYLPELKYGIAALALEPTDLYVLSSLGMAIPDNVKDSDLDREQRLDQGRGFDQQVIAAASSWMISSAGLDFGGRHYSEAQALTLRGNLEGPAYIALGRIAALRGKSEDAIAQYRQALTFETTPAQQAQLFYDIGVAEGLLHHQPEARAALAKARQLGPNSPLLLKLVQAEEDKLGPAGGGGS
ncbi:MAG: hypothetical protein ACRD1E_06370, partial [Terriglobales bacterium]